MNTAQRRRELLKLLAWARAQSDDHYEIYLAKDVFYDKAMAVARGDGCRHRRQLCDKTATNGTHMYYYFCSDCGLKLSEFIPHRALSPREIRQVSSDVRQVIVSARYEMTGLLREFYQAGWWQAYTAYLKSDHWRDLRDKVLYRDGYQCQLQLRGCTRAATQVHHITYAHVTREKMSELTSVCTNCHEQQHERKFYEEPQPENNR